MSGGLSGGRANPRSLTASVDSGLVSVSPESGGSLLTEPVDNEPFGHQDLTGAGSR